MIRRWRVAAVSSIAAAGLLGAILGPLLLPAAATGGAGLRVVAEPGLPPGSRVEEPLRRGPAGEIEPIGPEGGKPAGPYRCSAAAICVGSGQPYRTLSDGLAAAHEGATIEIVGGSYREAVTVRAPRLVLRGVAGTPRLDCTGLPLAGDKACLLIAADGVTLENLDIAGAALPDSLGGNGACLRVEPELGIALRRIACHASQAGLLADGGNVLIENSEFYDNGWNERAHNVDLGGRCHGATIRGSTFRDARVGDELRLRCRTTNIANSTFRSTFGGRNLNLPDGGGALVFRSLFVKSRDARGAGIIAFADQSCTHPGDIVLKFATIANSRRDAAIENFENCGGGAIVLEGVRFDGLPVRRLGYVLER